MTTTEQAEFVNELAGNIAKSITDAIDAGKVPATWDGYELRQLLADRAADASWALKENRRRWREYKNTVLVNNL